MTITKNTGLKNPQTVSQYAKYNNNTCSAWNRLETIKEDEVTDLSAVCYNLTNTKRSALIYCYNFGFNIPSNATITKITVQTVACQDDITKSHVQTQIVKLKLGANTTDSGVGNNLAPKKPWRTHKDAHIIGMQYATIGDSSSSVKDTWGVDVTPAIVNNSNFGVVFQCMADGTQKHKAYLDSISMSIEYTLPEETAIIQPIENKGTIDISLSTKKYNSITPTKILDQTIINQPYDSTSAYHFWVKYKNNAQTKNDSNVILDQISEPVIIETDGKLIFNGGNTSYTIPSQTIKGTSDSRYIISSTNENAPNYIEQFYDVYLFSNITDFNSEESYIESTVKLYSTKLSNGKYVKKALLDSITLEIGSSVSNIANSQTILDNCTFLRNAANKGAAIYNLGRLYVNNISFDDNHTHGTGRNNCAFFDVDICRDKEFE